MSRIIHSNDSPLVLRRQRRRARGARDLQRQGFATSPNVTKSCTLSHLQLQSSRPKKGLFAASLRTCFRDVIRDSGKDGEEKEGEAGRILSSFSESARALCTVSERVSLSTGTILVVRFYTFAFAILLRIVVDCRYFCLLFFFLFCGMIHTW